MVVCVAGLIALCSCSRRSDESTSREPGKPGAMEQIRKAVSEATLDANEQKALELYNRWAGFRAKLQTMLMDDGRLKLMLSKEQIDRDFVDPMGGGVMPTTKEGMDTFKEQFDKAYEAAKVVRAEAAKIFSEVRGQPPEVREIFWSLMSVHGLQNPILTRDGSKVVFIQSSHGSSTSVFEQDAVPLDPADTNPGDDVYVWDLATGAVDCVSVDALKWHRQFPAASADASTLAFLSQPGQDNKSERNVFVRSADGKMTGVLTEGPFAVENDSDKPVLPAFRMIGPPSISGDGSKLVFICGTYENREREDGYTFQQYYLVLVDRASGTTRSLIRQTDRLVWPVISGDGSTVMAFTTEPAFAAEAGKPWQPGDPPSGPLGLYLIPTDGGSPPKKIPLPDGFKEWPVSLWDKRAPLSISDDGKKASLELQTGGRTQVYFYDDAGGQTKLVSATAAGQPASEDCKESMISGDGRTIVFASYAKDLNVPTPPKLKQIYAYDTATGALEIASRDAAGKPLEIWCESPSINADGSLIAFLGDCESIPGAVSPALRSKVRTYKCKRMAVLRTKDRTIIPFGGRLAASAPGG